MRRSTFSSAVSVLVLCTTFGGAQVKISQVFGAGGNVPGIASSNDYVELYNTGSPQSLAGWSIQVAVATGTTWSVTSLPAVTLATGRYFLVDCGAGGLTAPELPALPTPDATGTTALAVQDFKVALLSSTTALVGGTPTYAGTSALVDFVGAGTANWNDSAAAGATFAAANNAPGPWNSTAIFRHDCGAQDTNVSKDDWAQGYPSPRNTATPPHLGMSVIGSVFPSTARDGSAVSLRCTPRICGTNASSPTTTVSADLTAFSLGSVAMHDDGVMGDDLAGDNVFMLNVTVPASQPPGTYQIPIFATGGAGSGGAYLPMTVVAAASTPANDNCTTAIAVPGPYPQVLSPNFTGAHVESNTVFGTTNSNTSGMGSRRGLWYSVAGTGNTMTASTCASAQPGSMLYVFCGTCDGMSEVISNDNSNACTLNFSAAIASWCSISGQIYYIWVAPDNAGASTATVTLTISDDGISCSNPIPCGSCLPPVAATQTEAEQGYGVATNDGCVNSAARFTDVVPPAYPASLALNGTARAMLHHRDVDAYRFLATTTDQFVASITGQAEGYQLVLAALSPGGTCPQTTLATSPISTRCGTTTVSANVIAGNWYVLQVTPFDLQGATPTAIFGGNLPAGGTYHYTASIYTGGPPANDSCAAAVLLTSGAVVVGNTALATNDTASGCDPFGRDLWYTIITTAVLTLFVDTSGSAIDTAVAVYGACGGTELGCNDDCSGCEGSGSYSCLALPSLPAGTYRIRVSDKGIGTGGAFSLKVAAAVDNDICCRAITIGCPSTTSGTTNSSTNEAASLPACLAPQTAVLTQSLAYPAATSGLVWYKIIGTGATIEATVAGSAGTTVWVFTGSCGALTCVTANQRISSFASESVVRWQTNPGQAYFMLVHSLGIFGSPTGPFNVTVGCTPTPTNDDCAAPAVLTPPTGGSIVGTTAGATCRENYTSASAYPSCTSSIAYVALFDAWYSYTACAAGTLSLDTCGTFGTLLSVHSACPGVAGPNNQIACNVVGPSGCSPGSQLSVAVTAGTTYLIRVVASGFAFPSGTFTLTWSATGSGAGIPWYQDFDLDGYGNAAVSIVTCTPPPGYVTNDDDCDDTNAAIKPGAAEVCDGVDNDCDGLTDEGVGTTWYQDSDGDTYGNPAVSQVACSAPSGYVSNDDDCNDTNAAIKPGAAEVCDGVDNDCDGLTDEGVGTTWYQDSDGDTYGNPAVTQLACAAPPGYVSNDDDCNDTNAAIKPGAAEVCANGIDDDCDTAIDEGCVPNEDCGDAIAISDGSIVGTNAGALTSITDTSCGAVVHDVWYSYTNPSACPRKVTASMCAPGSATFNAVIHVFSGSCASPILEVCDDSSGGCGEAEVTFTIPAGATWLIAVSELGPGSGGGAFKMQVSSATASMESPLTEPGCLRSVGPPGPTLSLNLPPVLSSPRTLSITGAAASSVGLVFISNPGGGFCTVLPTGCCMWLDQGSMIILAPLIFTDGIGNWSLSGFVPASPECGAITVQGFIFPLGGVPGFETTNGLELVFGF